MGQDLLTMCSDDLLEIHLTKALLAGGAAGSFDMPQMFLELRAACDAGSIWAPLWLGDLETVKGDVSENLDAEAVQVSEIERRQWYLMAAVRGHPDAMDRLETRGGKETFTVMSMGADDFAKWGLVV